ncbi:hypothetical protein HBI56_113700 [Parastagonospora nodorum]|nr:hypothetical protein HBH56_194540 [Parastagonospora nodorum]KAH3976560.1 hypothetical protein HBH52_117400 [Parastagonospora nodorum]KAH4026386.1 hypothetical protein HBI13_061610 [Parastagonospora nodorum]KAH4036450.1 hypothetical protein HBI09_073110 [Parastagonospora nodorum]KAH4067997.1 hypothetical protein HBH50_121260 [Parastagonospora nodorum]
MPPGVTESRRVSHSHLSNTNQPQQKLEIHKAAEDLIRPYAPEIIAPGGIPRSNSASQPLSPSLASLTKPPAPA